MRYARVFDPPYLILVVLSDCVAENPGAKMETSNMIRDMFPDLVANAMIITHFD